MPRLSSFCKRVSYAASDGLCSPAAADRDGEFDPFAIPYRMESMVKPGRLHVDHPSGKALPVSAFLRFDAMN